MSIQIKNICCIGAGYVGGPTMSVIADKCPSLTVNVVDINEDRINSWNNDNLENLPIFEPGLSEIIKKCRGRNLFFSTKIEENVACADIVFISVNTPTKKKGLGAGQASDLKWVEACARQVAKFAKNHTIVVEKSTLPVKTAEVIKKILESPHTLLKGDQKKSFDVLSNPEFLAEGTAIRDLEEPDRVLIGGDNEEAILALSSIYREWVPEEKILHTNVWSSELAKITSNAFLAQRISSINSIAALCESTGANISEVARAIGSDKRIGSKFLDAGPGFGGSCFKKDILNLVYLSSFFGLPEVANYWESVVKLNNWHQNRISKLIVQKLFGTITAKKICILGFAFKANTNDTRESSAIKICRDLMEEGANLFIHDPKVKSMQIESDLSKKNLNIDDELEGQLNYREGNWVYSNSIYEAVKGADAIVVLTEWEEYSRLDWELISTLMRQPAWIFDSRYIVNVDEIKKVGLNLWRIGDDENNINKELN